MKTKKHLYIISILLVFICCKKTTNTTKINEVKKITKQIDSIHKTKIQNDIYINNEYNILTEYWCLK